MVSCSKPLLLLEIPTVISDAAHETAIFSLSSDPFSTATKDRNHRACRNVSKKAETLPFLLLLAEEMRTEVSKSRPQV